LNYLANKKKGRYFCTKKPLLYQLAKHYSSIIHRNAVSLSLSLALSLFLLHVSFWRFHGDHFSRFSSYELLLLGGRKKEFAIVQAERAIGPIRFRLDAFTDCSSRFLLLPSFDTKRKLLIWRK